MDSRKVIIHEIQGYRTLKNIDIIKSWVEKNVPFIARLLWESNHMKRVIVLPILLMICFYYFHFPYDMILKYHSDLTFYYVVHIMTFLTLFAVIIFISSIVEFRKNEDSYKISLFRRYEDRASAIKENENLTDSQKLKKMNCLMKIITSRPNYLLHYPYDVMNSYSWNDCEKVLKNLERVIKDLSSKARET